MRGLKTLHIRMEASQKNAMVIALYLEASDAVEKVMFFQICTSLII
jgi:cystathionine beta-lyase/cystathionine gamma-synthase